MPKLAKYISDVEHLLNQRYGVSLAEIGIGEEEWLDRFGGEPAADAVEAFASKYDWSYPRKIDTRLCASALVFHRAEIAQSGVSSLSVIKDFDVLEDSGFGRCDRLETLSVDQLHLKPTKERFHRSIIPTISFTAHARYTTP